MNNHTLADPGALVLRLLVGGFFVLLSLLPLILRLWRGETSQDRGIVAEVERDRAELHADTAIAVKRAEVRAAIDTMWAEQQMASARMAVEAQLEIDREQQRRRVMEAIEPAVPAHSERIREVQDVYLPIAAEAEAASLVTAELPAVEEDVDVNPPENLSSRDEPQSVEPTAGRPLIPAIPDVTRAAARWLRPLVPPIIVNAIDTTTKPLRGARQIFEETEEIHFSLRRTRRVTCQVEGDDVAADASRASTVRADDREQGYDRLDTRAEQVAMTTGEGRAELTGGGQRELRGHRGLRELPPGR